MVARFALVNAILLTKHHDMLVSIKNTQDKITNILVIEDNPGVLEGITSILEYSGYSSQGEMRFNESIFRQLKAGRFDLIILDVMLSGADGREIARRLKRSEATKHVPILMMSAYHNIEDSVREAGADDFLSKPFGIDELLQKVERNTKGPNPNHHYFM